MCTSAENEPSAAAVVATVADDPSIVVPPAGAVTVMGTAAGGACRTYLSAVILGCSRIRPVPMSRMSRSSCACAQDSGAADPAGLPSAKPMEATVGSVPKGDGARAGFSQACSGTRPTPDEKPVMALSSPAAPPGSALPRSDYARSPDSTGHRCPVPMFVVGQGSPGVV